MPLSLADALVTQSTKGSHKLDKISELVAWKRYGYRIRKYLNRSELGRSSYDELKMFRAMILQRLYDLSDPEMEEMLYDRLSFRRFCGFGLTDKLPDETTICRFRNALSGHSDKLLALVNQDLESKGIKTRTGKIVDATVVRSSSRSPRGGEVSDLDPEAGWTKKGGQYIHGYKGHVSTDSADNFICKTVVTGADVHDSLVFGHLLDGDEATVFADKAYDSAKNRQLLDDWKIGDRVMYRSRARKKQPRWQIDFNRLITKQRCRIEACFGTLKTKMGFNRCRYRGLERNQNHLDLLAIAFNLNKATRLARA